MNINKEQIKSLYSRYHEYIDYILVGAMTSLVSWGSYAIFYYVFFMSNTASSFLSWLCAVIFAFFTNKVFVFRSHEWDSETLIKEGFKFLSSRSFTGLLEVGMMYLCVDVWAWNAMLMRVASSFVSTIINYVFSKFLIFKKS